VARKTAQSVAKLRTSRVDSMPAVSCVTVALGGAQLAKSASRDSVCSVSSSSKQQRLHSSVKAANVRNKSNKSCCHEKGENGRHK
jgi:uncharacterized protein (DUF427 family)